MTTQDFDPPPPQCRVVQITVGLLHRGWPEDGIISQYTACFGCSVTTHGGILTTRRGDSVSFQCTRWSGYKELSHSQKIRVSCFARNLCAALEIPLEYRDV